jgi:hypothetical protein
MLQNDKTAGKMQYPAHQAFIDPARTRPQMWRLLAGLGVVLAVYIGGFVIIMGILTLISGWDGAQSWMNRMVTGSTPTGSLLLLASFIGMALGTFAAVWLLHRRPIGTLFGPRPRLLRDFAIAVAVCTVVFGLMSLIPSDMEPRASLTMGLWLSFLPLAIVGILVQTGAEEVLFRGYLQQQLAARFASPLVWMVLPSVLFALAHYNPAEMGGNAWLIVGAVGLFALCAADLTAVTGSLGAAWGLHFANNTVAILIVALDGPLSGLALYTLPVSPMDTVALRPLIIHDMLATLAIWGIIRFLVTRPR